MESVAPPAAPSAGLTAGLAAWVAQLQVDHLPPTAHSTLQRGMIDCAGVLLAGRDEEVVRHAQALFQIFPEHRPGLSRVLADRGWADAAHAAMINVTAAHALDYDDTGLDGHPSVILAPVVTALAESLGCSKTQARCAYVAGYEVWAELSERDEPRHGKGWHPTAVFGCVAAAAATAWMLGLDAERTRHALGLAASMSAGLVGNFGSMTKPLQVGWAAQNGILAGRLARQGVTAAPDAIEGPRGLLVALSPAGRPRLDGPPEVGVRWRIESSGLNIKRYPICYALHRATDAALQLREQLAGATPDHIAVRLGRQQVGMLRPGIPASALDAKFSVPFAMACAFARGRVGLADLTDDAVHDPVIRQLMARVEVLVWDAVDATEPLFSPHDEVLVTLADGLQVRSEPVTRALGHASRPLDNQALRAKFLDCASATMAPEQAQVWWDELTKED